MKYIFFMLVILCAVGIQAQSFNQKQGDPQNTQLIGKINQDGLMAPPFDSWFIKNKNDYQPDPVRVKALSEQLHHYTITAFMGSWCGDSKREIPRLYKILEASGFDLNRLTMVAVDRERNSYKQSPGGEHEGKLIHRVPTIIISKNGEEQGRIVESTVVNLEDDLLQILKGAYTPKHSIVTLVDQLISNQGLDKFEKRIKKHAKFLLPHADSPFQLNTYANVLYYDHQKQQALIVMRLNTLLFPDNPTVLYNYAYRLKQSDHLKKALVYFEKVLSISPTHQKALQAQSEILSKLES